MGTGRPFAALRIYFFQQNRPGNDILSGTIYRVLLPESSATGRRIIISGNRGGDFKKRLKKLNSAISLNALPK
jgi:hypothetical protein